MGHHRARDGDEPDDLTVEQVRSTLRDAADGYRPDRTAMVNRVASGRAATLPPVGRRTLFRMPIAAALAVAFILVAGISAARVSWSPDTTVAADRPPVSVPAVPGTGSSAATGPDGTTPPAGTGTAGTTGATSPTTAPRSRATSGHPRNGPSATATLGTQTTPNGFVTSGGALDSHSTPTWSQNNVTISSRKPIVELIVVVTVARTPGVTYHGDYTDAPNLDIVRSKTSTDTSLTYTFRLADGKTLAAGDYLFAAQFAHKPGRDNTDSYTVVVRTADAAAELTGDFIR